ncbi:MAG: hypothetical protein A3I89_00910 [Candidatus Harrisonbacteria bacterium RIFCSPLOWO2_02_FULL_41_11]|nr:MAG: hypothetical protein A3I89_00910 [Candidatus Harrisonbacteria bacterium RIFCSPLOWO2_02_FULL_41_11]
MHKHANTIKEKEVVLWVNISLIGISLLLLFYYVMMANAITAKDYLVNVLREKVESLTVENVDLMSAKLAMETPAKLLEFASTKNLIKASGILYIFENKNVAQR